MFGYGTILNKRWLKVLKFRKVMSVLCAALSLYFVIGIVAQIVYSAISKNSIGIIGGADTADLLGSITLMRIGGFIFQMLLLLSLSVFSVLNIISSFSKAASSKRRWWLFGWCCANGLLLLLLNNPISSIPTYLIMNKLGILDIISLMLPALIAAVASFAVFTLTAVSIACDKRQSVNL